MLFIHVRILVKVGEEARVAAAIAEATPLFRQEEGNLVYEPSQSTADPCVFFCAERWADQAALDRAMGRPGRARPPRCQCGLATP